MNNKGMLGALVVTALGSLAAHAVAADSKAPDTAGSKDHACVNNECKGHSDCMGYGNADCAGSNECKGHGIKNAMNEAECTKKNGKWVAKEKKKKS